MDEATVRKIRAEANRGIEAVKMRRNDQAGVSFNSALYLTEDLEDERTRRDEVSTLSGVFERCGFPDLALQAAEEAVDLDRRLGLESLMGQDMLAVGNAHFMMQNTTKAQALFREALDIFVKREEWANAASASTNIASIVADGGDLAEAIKLLETSLDYLAKEPFDDTEINTRFALMQALEFEERDVEQAIENGRQLCSRFWDQMADMHRDIARDFVARAIKRHPLAGSAVWKAKTFPMLYQ